MSTEEPAWKKTRREYWNEHFIAKWNMDLDSILEHGSLSQGLRNRLEWKFNKLINRNNDPNLPTFEETLEIVFPESDSIINKFKEDNPDLNVPYIVGVALVKKFRHKFTYRIKA
jgi:hypothetical protein